MMREATADEFVLDPLGRFVRGGAFIVWCFEPSLCGAVYWGRPTVRDTESLERVLEFSAHPALRAPFDVLTDARLVSGLAADAFEALLAYTRERALELACRVRRHAIVHADDLTGAAIAGFYALVEPRYAWRAFSDVAGALAWLEPRNPGAIGRELAHLAASAGPGAVERLRAVLAGANPPASVNDAATALGMSTRSLQRALHSAGSTFRKELERNRVAKAEALLERTDEKLDAVARAVGLWSRGSLIRVLRRAGAKTGSRPRG